MKDKQAVEGIFALVIIIIFGFSVGYLIAEIMIKLVKTLM